MKAFAMMDKGRITTKLAYSASPDGFRSLIFYLSHKKTGQLNVALLN
jgi:hypothetical protein